MVFPVKFQLFGQSFHWHFILETLAFFAGVRLYYYLRKGIADPVSDEDRLWIMLGAMVGALIGSRFFAVLEAPAELGQLSWAVIYQSKTIAGGLLGGLLGVELIKKLIGVHVASGDVYVFPILLALFIGRIGCFLMGTDEPVYGVETSWPWGMDLGDGLLRHPAALYEMAYVVLMALFFYITRRHALAPGERFKAFMILYFFWRFMVEFIKPYQPLFFWSEQYTLVGIAYLPLLLPVPLQVDP